jgi:hypothetical protein
MLGDLFYEAKGRITSKRVLDLELVEIESSYYGEGKMREIEVVEIVSKVICGSNFYSSLTTGKLSFLNNLVGVHEALVDNDGNIIYKVWEWN